MTVGECFISIRNMKYLRIFLITSLWICPTLLWADIYKYTDEEGVVHFTNAPYNDRYEFYLREAPDPRYAAKGNEIAWIMQYAERFSKTYNMSPALVKAIIRAESNGDRFAVSRKGAKGMMQLMPFTSKRLKVNDPFDPVENIEGGVKYMKELLGTFGGNIVHAVAAYNAGPAAVKKYGGIPPYQETRLYVKRVMNYYQKYSSME